MDNGLDKWLPPFVIALKGLIFARRQAHFPPIANR
jgi:hypothetical protein